MKLDAISLTRRLLAFHTVNPPGDERDCARYLGRLLETAGFHTGYYEFAERRTSLIASLPGNREKHPICFTGHLDTVPLGGAAWSRDAFTGEVDGDRLFGRGASDMKAGVAAMTIMALRLARLPDRKAGLTIIFTAGEENACDGARHLAGFPDALGRAGAIVVGEATANAPWIAHKGCARYTIRVDGVAAHASMPEKGVNAIYRAAAAIEKLACLDFDLPPHPFLGDQTLAVTMMSAGTALNMIPDCAEFCIDVRTLPGQTEESVRRRLEMALGPEVALRKIVSAAGVGTSADHEWIREVFGVVESFSGERPVPAGAAYVTDCSILTPAYGNPPTVILGPGEPGMIHKTDEYCHMTKIKAVTEIYTEIARRWCAV